MDTENKDSQNIETQLIKTTSEALRLISQARKALDTEEIDLWEFSKIFGDEALGLIQDDSGKKELSPIVFTYLQKLVIDIVRRYRAGLDQADQPQQYLHVIYGRCARIGWALGLYDNDDIIGTYLRKVDLDYAKRIEAESGTPKKGRSVTEIFGNPSSPEHLQPDHPLRQSSESEVDLWSNQDHLRDSILPLPPHTNPYHKPQPLAGETITQIGTAHRDYPPTDALPTSRFFIPRKDSTVYPEPELDESDIDMLFPDEAFVPPAPEDDIKAPDEENSQPVVSPKVIDSKLYDMAARDYSAEEFAAKVRKNPNMTPEDSRKVIGDLTTIARISGGAFADVYLAQSPEGEYRIIKVGKGPETDDKMLEESFRLFELEYYQASHGLLVNGKSVTPEGYRMGKIDSSQYIVMDLAEGIPFSDLSLYLRPGEILPLEDTLTIIEQTLRAIEALHEGLNMSYHDFQPRNIYWDKNNRKVTVVDWNLLGGDRNVHGEIIPVDKQKDLDNIAKLLYRLASGKFLDRDIPFKDQLGNIPEILVRKVIESVLSGEISSARELRFSIINVITAIKILDSDQPAPQAHEGKE